MSQAFKLGTTETVAPPGGGTVEAIRAPSGELSESKRANIIEHVEENLEIKQQQLKDSTILRNQEYERKLREVAERARHFEQLLQKETTCRDADHQELQGRIAQSFNKLSSEHCDNVLRAFEAINQNMIPPSEKRLDVLNANVEEFVNVTVPSIIENLQGTVTRKLKKQRETFDIENAKLMKRESKIGSRFEAHKRNTADILSGESATRFEQFLSLSEHIDETHRIDDRTTEHLQVKTVQDLAKLKNQMKDEGRVRSAEDCLILNNLAESMAQLQKSILLNFGVEGDDEESRSMEE